MKKRLLCLVLIAVMLLSAVLTGCKKKEDLEEALQQTATTLSMWVVSENKVEKETAEIVSNAINAVTNSRLKVKLIINYLTEDDYRETLDRKIRDYIDVRATQPKNTAVATETQTTAVTEVETVVDELGFTSLKYPDLLENQVDIIYIQGENMYLEYIQNGWLSALDNELTGSSKQIKEYMNNALLAAAKYGSGTYAVPNNHAIGSYTVMLLNKELMKETDMEGKYLLDAGKGKNEKKEIDGFFNANIYSYLEDVYNKKMKYGATDIVPIASTYEQCLQLLAHYWDIDPDTLENRGDLSLLGYYYTDPTSATRSTALRFDSLFTNEAFTNAFLKIRGYELDGNYFGKEAEGKQVALAIKEMDYQDYITYRDDPSSEYYPVILKYPTIKASDVYDHMFGVCSKTVSLSHSMEVITLLNTNADFRNLLQYGVEGKTYRLEPDPSDMSIQRVELLSEHPYHMDVFKTGNAFLAYPEPGMDLNEWTYGIQQNLDVVGVDPSLNVNFRNIALSSIQTAAAPTAGTSKFIYTYTPGLSREILAQNQAISDWIAESDQQGKGSYLLQTTQTDGQNVTSYCYFYNNQYQGTATASEADGTITIFCNGTEAGETFGMLAVYAKRNSVPNIAAKINGANVDLTVKTRYAAIPVDLLNTDTYAIRVSTGISKTNVATNSVIWNWIRAYDEAVENETATGGVPQVLCSSKIMENGKTKYTYLVYTTGLTKAYTVQANPTGTDQKLNLELVFSQTAGAASKNYALWLVTVEADPTVEEVNFSLVKDGAKATPVVTDADTDPTFTYCGTLDSELVRYLDSVNRELVAKINACTGTAELKALISELNMLLTPHTDLTELPEASSFTVLADFVASHDLTELNYALLCATSTASVAHKALATDAKTGAVSTVDVKADPVSGENYILLDSPFKLYYTWMTASTRKYISK